MNYPACQIVLPGGMDCFVVPGFLSVPSVHDCYEVEELHDSLCCRGNVREGSSVKDGVYPLQFLS